jgi:hypothetical protein
MVSETKNKLNKLFISTFIEWIARFSFERFWLIFWQYERPTNWHQFLARGHVYQHRSFSVDKGRQKCIYNVFCNSLLLSLYILYIVNTFRK